MDTEDEEQFCSNCKRSVSSANFATHTAFCERNIFVCKICDEPVQISEKEQHLEEYHVIFPCDLCGFSVEKWMLPKHMESCPKRLTVCKYCEAEFPFNEYSEHIDFCGSRTEKCLLCQKYVMIKEKDKHSESHIFERKYHTQNIREEIKQNKVNEDISKIIVERGISNKISGAKHYDVASKVEKVSGLVSVIKQEACSRPVGSSRKNNGKDQNFEILDDVGAVASLPAKRKESSKHYTQCNICKQTIPWIDYNTHVPSCASSVGKCAICGEDVSDDSMKDHIKKCQRKLLLPSFVDSPNFDPSTKVPFENDESYAFGRKVKDRVIKCPFCSQMCSEDRILEHARICPKNVYECPLCCETVQEADKATHEKYGCRMIHDNDEPKKPYFSKESAVFECPLCSEDIPEEKRETHLSMSCKKLFESNETHNFYNAGDDTQSLYECPYCTEKMPKEDKKRHETFECKVLIENSGVNLSDPKSYAEITKKACKGNCKSHQQVEMCCTCKNKFPKDKILEHQKNCKRLKLPCLHCKQLIDPACEMIHLRDCPAMTGNKKYTDYDSRVAQNSKSSNYEQRGAKPKNTNFGEMMAPRSAKCLYCRTTLNADIVKFHEEECLYKPVKCSSCLTEMLLKDCESHKCKRKKGKGKNKKEQDIPDEKEGYGFWKAAKTFFNHGVQKHEVKDSVDMHPPNYYVNHEPVPSDIGKTERLYFEQADETLIPCEFCLGKYPASEIVLHETGCQPDLVSYAKPDFRQGNVLLPAKLDAVGSESVPTNRPQIVHETGVSGSFFAGKSSFSPSAKYERIEHNIESEVKPGEFLLPYSNKRSSSSHEHLESNKTASEKKKTEPLILQSVMNVVKSDDLRTDDDNSEQISDCSDTEIGVNKVQKTTNPNERERKYLELEREFSLHDDEMSGVLDFLKDEECAEYDEEYSILSDEKERVKDSKTILSDVLDSKYGTKEEHQRDMPMTDEDCKQILGEALKHMDCSVKKKNEYANRCLADFRFGTSKSSAGEDNVHHSVRPKEISKDQELYKQRKSKYVESFENQEEHTRSVQETRDMKVGRCESTSVYGNNYMNQIFPSGKDDKEPKDLENFRFGMNESIKDFADLKLNMPSPAQEVMRYPMQYQTSDRESEKQNGRETRRSSCNREDKKGHGRYFGHLDDRKPSTHLSPSFTGKENEYDVSFGGIRKHVENLYKQKTSSSIDNTIDDKEYIQNFKHHLSDFTFQTKSVTSEDNPHTIALPEKKKEHSRERAFKLEPVKSLLKESMLSRKKENKEVEGLEEKIAKLNRRSFVTDSKGDAAKWNKWRESQPRDGSGSD